MMTDTSIPLTTWIASGWKRVQWARPVDDVDNRPLPIRNRLNHGLEGN